MYTYRLPYYQATLIGYCGECCFSAIAVFATLAVNGSFLILFFSICLHHQAFSQMMHHSIVKFNRDNEKERNSAEFLCKMIRFHITVKE